MALQAFTDNFADNSTEAGFQFTFFCAICQEGYKTKFIPSKSYKKGRFFKGLGGLLGAAAQIAGKSNIGYGIERGTDVIGERFAGMSPEWQKDHDTAFASAQAEAKAHFHRCPKCTQWVCENDWNEQEGLCTSCGPREALEVASARARKKTKDIEAKAEATQVFTGQIEGKQTLCPACGKPAGAGKFCINCGLSLKLKECAKCGAKNPAGIGFCGECGEKLPT
ncbi:zinc ribbon domain-containing protein [Patescibacteria group bacterium]|nr:zinc ribbon domain-containing protein [Patescibacteria group bacterium]